MIPPEIEDQLNDLKEKLNKIRQQNLLWQRNFNYLFELKHNGEIYEKNGNMIEAIKAYNHAFEFGKNNFNFNNYASIVERLFILYRKTKNYQEEIDMLNFALSQTIHKNVRIKYEQRLKKAEQLKNNQQ
jgi:tetratricopeptide (TPR) repeat protein